MKKQRLAHGTFGDLAGVFVARAPVQVVRDGRDFNTHPPMRYSKGT
jgi:hypothetical protein